MSIVSVVVYLVWSQYQRRTAGFLDNVGDDERLSLGQLSTVPDTRKPKQRGENGYQGGNMTRERSCKI